MQSTILLHEVPRKARLKPIQAQRKAFVQRYAHLLSPARIGPQPHLFSSNFIESSEQSVVSFEISDTSQLLALSRHPIPHSKSLFSSTSRQLIIDNCVRRNSTKSLKALHDKKQGLPARSPTVFHDLAQPAKAT